MVQQTRYREIEVGGTSFDMGRQIGEVARDEIRGFAAIALERVNKTMKVSRHRALETAAASFKYVEGYSADMLEELRGMAETSGVAVEELMLLQVRNQLQPDADAGCTSFAVAPQASVEQHAMVGQNWDNDPALDPFTVVLTRRPTGKPAFMSVTQAGLIAYIGLNDRGIGVCMNTLPAPNRPLGVPHYFTVRGIFEADSLDGAVEAVARAERAIPANIILSTPQGPADLEVTVDDVYVLRDEGQGYVTHTNHCLHPDLLSVNDDFPDLIESTPRKLRIEKIFGEVGGQLSMEVMQAALKDHENYPKSMCRHPNEHPTNGYWVSVFSVIIEADAGRMHLTRGNPCENPYETYSLN